MRYGTSHSRQHTLQGLNQVALPGMIAWHGAAACPAAVPHCTNSPTHAGGVHHAARVAPSWMAMSLSVVQTSEGGAMGIADWSHLGVGNRHDPQ